MMSRAHEIELLSIAASSAGSIPLRTATGSARGTDDFPKAPQTEGATSRVYCAASLRLGLGVEAFRREAAGADNRVARPARRRCRSTQRGHLLIGPFGREMHASPPF